MTTGALADRGEVWTIRDLGRDLGDRLAYIHHQFKDSDHPLASDVAAHLASARAVTTSFSRFDCPALNKGIDPRIGYPAPAIMLAEILRLAHARVLELAEDVSQTSNALNRALDLAVDLDASRSYAIKIFHLLEHLGFSASKVAREDAAWPQAQVAMMSRRLTRYTVWALPVTRRLKYAEMFHSELLELAENGHSRWAQVVHALRVLIRVPQLRRELRTPASAAGERGLL